MEGIPVIQGDDTARVFRSRFLKECRDPGEATRRSINHRLGAFPEVLGVRLQVPVCVVNL